MAYSTLAEMIERFGEGTLIGLTDRGELATGQIDESVVEKALDDASAEIDGYLGARYNLPLTEVPVQIPPLAEILAYWNLHTSEPDEKTKIDRKSAERMLRDIADGRIRLDIEGREPQGNGSTGAQFTDRDRPFDAKNMSGFI